MTLNYYEGIVLSQKNKKQDHQPPASGIFPQKLRQDRYMSSKKIYKYASLLHAAADVAIQPSGKP
jgi:hypothetical protein